MFNFHNDFSQWSTKEGMAASTLWGPLLKLQQITNETCDQAAREWTSFMTDSMSTMMKGVQILPGVKKPEDYSNIQMKLMTDQMRNLMEFTDHMSSVFQNAYKNQQEWMQEMMNTTLKTFPSVQANKQ